MERESSRQRELEAERRRVADMQRRQLEQEQFSMFEEMIRQQEQERQRERHHVIDESGTLVRPRDETLLVPGVQGPPVAFPACPSPPPSPQYPWGNGSGPCGPSSTASPAAAPPTFDRSLKPGHRSSSSSNSRVAFGS